MLLLPLYAFMSWKGTTLPLPLPLLLPLLLPLPLPLPLLLPLPLPLRSLLNCYSKHDDVSPLTV
jgi:hypothetical protein